LERDVRFLKAYAFALTLACAALVLSAFTWQGRRQRFAEIDVERVNVVEKDGSLRLVISNKGRSPAPAQRGKPFGYEGGTRAGLIFYNGEGTENGGLTFGGRRGEGGKVEASGSLTFDQYEQDQAIALQYYDSDGRRRSGLAITDYPTDMTSMEFDEKVKALNRMPDGAAREEERRRLRRYAPKLRMYAGRGRDGNSLVQLSDAEGRTRLRLVVDASGGARIEFLDEAGKVTQALPAPAAERR
jgi:hypothetical protein